MADGGDEHEGIEGVKKRHVLRLQTNAPNEITSKRKNNDQRRDEMRRAQEADARMQFKQKGIRPGFGVYLEWKQRGVVRKEYVTIVAFRTSFTRSNQKVGVEISFGDSTDEQYVQFRNIIKVSPVR